jgi:hypothetical protein
MRTLTATTEAALAQIVTRPGLLVEFLTDPPLRLSSRGDVSALGNTWQGWDVIAQGLGLEAGRPSPSGQLALGDVDQSISAVLLNAATGLRVRVWKFTAEGIAEDSNDVELIFDGALGELNGDIGNRRVVASLVTREGAVLFIPRRYCTSETGFNAMSPNKIVTFNGEKYSLEPER